jgi:prevent-host-death family protein
MPSQVTKVVRFTEARAHLGDLLDEVEREHEHLVITRRGRPVVVVMSMAEYDALEETLAVLDDPEALKALRESAEDVAAGRLYSVDVIRRDAGLACGETS